MKGVNDKSFLNLWQIVYRATVPSATHDHWRVSEVDWRRQRHHFSGESYSFSIETHTLSCLAKSRSGWSLFVVVENWWDQDHETMRSSVWARSYTGNKRSIIEWFKSQGRAHDVPL